MRRLLLAVLVAPSLGAQQSPRPDSGWAAPLARMHDYAVTIDTSMAHTGRASARIAAAVEQPSRQVTLHQMLRADSLRGRRVRFTTWLATRDLRGTGAHLYATAYGRRVAVATANDRHAPVTGTLTWTPRSVELDVPDSAIGVTVGVFVQGSGVAWVDDVTAEPVGPAAPATPPRGFDYTEAQAESFVRQFAAAAVQLRGGGFEGVRDIWQGAASSRPLEGAALQNVVAFARLLGYVRFFHPAREALSVNWDDFTLRGIRAVEIAPTPDSLARTMQSLFAPVAPTVEIYASGTTPRWRPSAPPDTANAAIAAWYHRGMGVPMPSSATPTRPSVYYSLRIVVPAPGGMAPDSLPDPREPMRVALGGGVGAIVPLALWDTLPSSMTERMRRATPAAPSMHFSYENRETRLAAVVTLWNAMQHFYPYFDVVDTDWMAELPLRLGAAATASLADFDRTLRLMVAALRDGHGNVYMPTPLAAGRQRLQVVLAGAEGRIVIAHATDAAPGMRRGDELLAVNGMPIARVLAEREPLVSGSAQWKRSRALSELTVVPDGARTVWRLRGTDGRTRDVVAEGLVDQTPLAEPRPEKVAELRPGIMYVDIDRITDADWAAALPRLRQARGIVFDLRGYPRHVSTVAILAAIARAPLRSAPFEIPLVTRPDRDGMRFFDGAWPVQPSSPPLTAKIAWVTDGRAISYAETTMGIVEHFKLGEIVGEPTAATNGNVNAFTLPGGARIAWTGMRVRKHDGSRFHLVGVLPTIPSKRTVQGVAAGRDELLEKAIEVVASP